MASDKKRPSTGRATTLVVSTGRASGAALRLQKQGDRPDRWTAAKETRFLNELARTANVRHSLRIVGMSAASLYYRRRSNTAFETAWDSALNQGYSRLEAEMLARAIGEAVIADAADAPAGPPMSDATRMALLSAHAKRVGQYRATQAAQPQADVAKLKREIAARLDRLARSAGLEVKR